MTFRTFTTAENLLDSLVARYELDHPPDLSNAEFDTWKEKKLRPTQKRVLTVLTMWLEDHQLLEEEPHIARRLSDFLSLILTPSPLALTAKLILKSVERLVRVIAFQLFVHI
jgi:son of sevenless-like protein